MKRGMLLWMMVFALLTGCTVQPIKLSEPATESSLPAIAFEDGVWEQLPENRKEAEDLSFMADMPLTIEALTIEELYEYAHDTLGRNELFYITWATQIIPSPNGQFLAYASNKSNLSFHTSLHVLNRNTNAEHVYEIDEQSSISPLWWIDDSTLVVMAASDDGRRTYKVCTLAGALFPLELGSKSFGMLAYDQYYFASFDLEAASNGNGITEYVIWHMDDSTFECREIARFSSDDDYLTWGGSIDEERAVFAGILQAKNEESYPLVLWEYQENRLFFLHYPEMLSMAETYPKQVRWQEEGLEVIFGRMNSDATETWRYVYE